MQQSRGYAAPSPARLDHEGCFGNAGRSRPKFVCLRNGTKPGLHNNGADPIGIRQRSPSMRGQDCIACHSTEPDNSGRLVQALEQADEIGLVAASQRHNPAAEQLPLKLHRLLATVWDPVRREWGAAFQKSFGPDKMILNSLSSGMISAAAHGRR
jgi:hypothetical protein